MRTDNLPPLSELATTRDWLTPEEVGERLGYTTNTLKRWRVTGGGPKFARLSPRRAVYFIADILEWERARPRASSTTEMEQLEREAK